MCGQRWDSVSAGVFAKVFGALLLSGLSTRPGTEYQLDLALCLPHGSLELGWSRESKGEKHPSSCFCKQLLTRICTSSSPSASPNSREADFYWIRLATGDNHNQKPLTSPGHTEVLICALLLTTSMGLCSLSMTMPQFPHLTNNIDTTPMMVVFLGSSCKKKERLHQGPILQQP